MGLNRRQIGQIYRPVGPKAVQTGLAWASGGSNVITQGIDLSLPIRGIRLVFKGRLVIGTANLASATPEGLLNLISNVKILGTNKRQNGNVTLYDIDLATQYTMCHLFAYKGAAHLDVGGTVAPVPTLPYPSTIYNNVNTGTYDFRIVVDFPFHPFEAPFATRAGWLVRQEEWRDSLQIVLNYATVAGGAVAGPLGTGAAGTTLTLTAFGSGAGSPTIDIYSLPVIMGDDLKDDVNPGVISRVQNPINTVLQAAGSNIILQNMQKQPTSRVILKTGTSTVSPFFATLSDTNVTALGISLGGNRSVRNKVDVFAHKLQQPDAYDRDMIQGYTVQDFVESGNPDSAYPGDLIGEGASFQLVGDVTGVANAFGIIVQEMILHRNAGALYTF